MIPFWNDLDNLVTEFANAIEKSHTRSLVDMEHLKQVRKQLLSLLKVIRNYLLTYYDDDVVALASTGFDLSKLPIPRGVPPAPDKLIVTAVAAGEMLLTTAPYAKGKGYQFEYCLEGDTIWQAIMYMRNKLTVRGLKSKETYQFRVAYVGSTTERKYSNIVTSNIL